MSEPRPRIADVLRRASPHEPTYVTAAHCEAVAPHLNWMGPKPAHKLSALRLAKRGRGSEAKLRSS